MATEKPLNEQTIFVSIASCREPFLIEVIKNCLLSADNPKRIYFGIFDTICDESDLKLTQLQETFNRFEINTKEKFDFRSNIIYMPIHSVQPLGIGFSRANASLLYNKNHDFLLQIDAQVLFEKGWDQKIINNYYNIKEKYNNDKIILSVPPLRIIYKENNFYIASYGNHILIDDINNFNEDQKFFNSGLKILNGTPPYIYGENKKWDNDLFYETSLIHACTMFSKFNLCREIMHDPRDSFHGDQLNYSMRVLSRGWQIFAFKNPTFLCIDKNEIYDFNSLKDVNFRYIESDLKIIKDNFMFEYKKYLVSNEQVTRENIFSGKEFGYWGAPDKESLIYAKKKMGIEKYWPIV